MNTFSRARVCGVRWCT